MLKNKNSVFTAVAVSIIFLGVTSSTSALSLYRQLQIGMSGSDVSELQSYLASKPSLYPEGIISGYFGSLTRAAVRRFQAMAGITQVGRVGPQTMAALNSGNFVNSNGNLICPFIQNVSTPASYGGVTINWSTDELTKGVVYYSDTPLNTYEMENGVAVYNGKIAKVDDNMRNSQSLTINGLQSNTTYYYMIYVTDQDGNVSVSVPWNTFRTN